MSSDSESSTSSSGDEEEVESLREQMKIYRHINDGLAKQVQELKISLSASNRELIVCRNELMAEKLNISGFIRTMNISHMQVTNFYESYLRNMTTYLERTNLELELPEHNQAGTSDVNQNAIALKSKRGQQPVNMEQNKELNTILEETGDENLFDSINAIVSSTPHDQREIVEQQESSVTADTLQPFETISTLTSAPKRSSANTSIRNRSSTRPLTQRISEETSSEDESSPRKDIYVNHRRRNITTVSSNTDAIDEYQDSDEDYPNDSLDQSNFKLKKPVLNDTKLDISASTTKRFKKAFQDAESDEDEDGENRASKEGSVDSCSSSTSAITSTSNRPKIPPNTSKGPNTSRKRKALVEVQPRTNRPKRKSRPDRYFYE